MRLVMNIRWIPCVQLSQLVESTCKEMLAGLHIKAFNESKQEIANQLSKAEDPTSGIDDAVKACMTKFVESCEGNIYISH